MEQLLGGMVVGAAILLVLLVVTASLYWRATKAKSQAEHDLALAIQNCNQLQAQVSDRESVKTELVQAAQAAALTSARELSNKLLDDHKRERDTTRSEDEKRVKETTKGLFEKFENVVASVKSLGDRVTLSDDLVGTLHRALSSPGGAGYFAEIGLENTLKSFGLEPKRDFVVRHVIEGEGGNGKLVPDALVFLPGDSLLVIDCKASKFLVELAQAEGGESEQDAYQRLLGTMNGHLKALAAKDYRSAVIASYREARHETQVNEVLSVMYLPNEGALEKVRKADPEFQKKAAMARITVVGPAGLASFISIARVMIDRARQADNQRLIIEQTQSLLESVAVALSHADKVGLGLKSAADNFAKFAGSVNSRLLRRAHQLGSLGVRRTSNKDLPKNLSSFQVHMMESADVIEGDSEEIAPTPELTDEFSDRD